ncbi:MAG: DUF2786 domain-containing protein [Planctomycetota bacterium]
MTDRAQAVALARKLKALAENPGATEPEAQAARTRLEVLIAEHGITEAELVDQPIAGLSPEFEEMLNHVYDQKTNSIDFDALDDLLRQIPDPGARSLLRGISGAARLVGILFRRRHG